MHNFSDQLNSTTALPMLLSTNRLENLADKALRRAIYDMIQIIFGILVSACNVPILLAFLLTKRSSITTRVIATVTLIATIHGCVFAFLYTWQRRNRYQISPLSCVLSTLIITIFDNLLIFLLPLHAVAVRCITEYSTKLGRRVLLQWTLSITLITPLLALFPLIPVLNIPKVAYQTNSTAQKNYIERLYFYYNCHNRLNVINVIQPYYLLAIQMVFLAATIFIQLRNALSPTQNVQHKHLLKQVWIIIVLVAVTQLPYSANEIMRSRCGSLKLTSEVANHCSASLLELRFSLKIIFHMINILLPWTMLLMNEEGVAMLRGAYLRIRGRQKASNDDEAKIINDSGSDIN